MVSCPLLACSILLDEDSQDSLHLKMRFYATNNWIWPRKNRNRKSLNGRVATNTAEDRIYDGAFSYMMFHDVHGFSVSSCCSPKLGC